MSKKIMRIAQDGMLYVNRLNEGDSFSINPNFVEIGGELIEGYPFVKPVIDDSLILWLDGSTGNNYEQTGTWKDLSGNGNDGELKNFDFTEDSGWVDGGLRFDGVDDYVQLPDLALNQDNFTIQVDDKIRAFNGDKVMTENGDEWGRNLIKNSKERYKPDNQAYIVIHSGLIEDGKYTLSFKYEIEEENEIVNNFLVYIGRSVAWADVANKPIGKTSVTFSISKNDLNKPIYLYIGENAHVSSPNSGWFRKLKLEKGSTATPWTPAPEDITETNIINHNTLFVENNTIHTLRFYNRALTDEEIMQNYQAGQCSPLLAKRGDV